MALFHFIYPTLVRRESYNISQSIFKKTHEDDLNTFCYITSQIKSESLGFLGT